MMNRNRTTWRLPGMLTIWLLLALAIGASPVLGRLPLPAMQGIIVVLTSATMLSWWKVRLLRTSVDGQPLQRLASFHLTRFVGFYFLLLYNRGELPYAFAVPGGCGDIAVATAAALLILLRIDSITKRGRRVWLAWNVLGLCDIVAVVITAGRCGLRDPASMQALTHLPLSLLPTFIVPLIIATHLIMLHRLWPKRMA